MTSPMIDNLQRAAAKIAGWSYIFSFAIVVFANYVLLNPLIVPRNAADTARNLLAHPTQFRIALTLFLTYSVGAVVLAGALYIILRPINHYLALIGALFRLVFAMSWLLSVIYSLGALRCWETHYLQVFEPDRLQALARVMIASTFDDLLCRSAVLWIGRDGVRLVVAQIELYPPRIVDLRRDCIRVVRALRCCLPDLSRVQQDR